MERVNNNIALGPGEKMEGKDVLLMAGYIIFGLAGLALLVQQLGFIEGPGSTGSRPSPCGHHGGGFGKIKPMAPSIYLTYDGTFHSSVMNGAGAPVKITNLEVMQEEEYLIFFKRTVPCDLQEPEIVYKMGAGEIFELIAQCPPSDRNAEHASIYVSLSYEIMRDDKIITFVENGWFCLDNDGEEFDY